MIEDGFEQATDKDFSAPALMVPPTLVHHFNRHHLEPDVAPWVLGVEALVEVFVVA